MRRLFTVLVLLCGLLSGYAQSADEFYVRIYNTIQEGDTLAANSNFPAALQKYRDARISLERFQKGNPDWNAPIVKYRLAYLDEKIAQVSARVPPEQQQRQAPPPGQQPGAPGQAPSSPAVGLALEAQVNALQEQVRALQGERRKLEAKLKEALAVQPAAVDPRELAKAEQRIQTLQKENELLKFAAEQAKTRPPQPPQPPSAQPDALADANRRLNEQIESIRTLELEKKALEEKLKTGAAPAAAPQSSPELDRANSTLSEYQEMIQRLTAERDALMTRVKALEADSKSAASLKSENERLQKELAAAKTAPGSAAPAAAAPAGRVTELEAQLAALKSEKDILLLERQALQGRVKALQSQTNALATLPPAPPTREELRQIKELEKERDALVKKLAAANRELADRKGGGSGRSQELQTELATIRQRLEVLEAQKVPYTEEELALFRVPAPAFADQASKAGPPPRKFSASVAGLAAEAQRDFKAGRLEEAEAKFEKVLKEDNKDVITLANLATVQMGRKEYAQAEKNINRALEIAPEDAFTVALLGRLRFEQRRLDDAMDALSRAAKLDPKNAEIQNHLGLVLSEKGLRAPAETALRKAIQLQPNYGDAHQNLAVAYLSQNPPLVELAKYHYAKSLAAGSPANPKLESLIESKRAVK